MLFVVLASMVGVLAAAPMQAAHKTCCLPRQFSATLLQVGATLKANSTNPEITDATIVLNYDYDMKMERILTKTLNEQSGQMETVHVWMDYNNSRTYALVNNACYVSKVEFPMNSPCAEDNGTYVGSHVIGGGANMIKVDSYLVNRMGFTVRFEVEPTSCTPVAFQQYGDLPNGSRSLESYIFTDVKPSFTMANPFVLPDACKNAVMTAVGK